MHSFHKTLIAIAVAAGSVSPSIAQDAASNRLLTLEEVVVTARKRVEMAQDIPIAISALTADQLEARGLSSLQDFAVGTIPSLKVQPFPSNPATLTVAIRGIGQSDAGQATREPGVGIYVDGVYLGRAQGLGSDLADIERVEVLRGPQGTLFGRNAVGGAVSFHTSDPAGELALEQVVSAGSDGYFKAVTHLDLPEVAGISSKIDFLTSERDGWIKNSSPGSEDYNRFDKEGYRISLIWDPTDSLSLKYAYDNSDIETTQTYFQIHIDRENLAGFGALGLLGGAPGAGERDRMERTRFPTPFLEPSNNEQSGHTLTAEWEVSDNLSIKSISAYRELDEHTRTNYGGALGLGLITDDQVDQEQMSQEFQFIGSSADGSIDYVAGLYYYKEDVGEISDNDGWLIYDFANLYGGANGIGGGNLVSIQDAIGVGTVGSAGGNLGLYINNFFGTFFGAPLDPNPLNPNLSDLREVKATTESYAAYGQATWTPDVLDQRLHLTAGIRYTEDEKNGTRPFFGGQADSAAYDLNSESVDPTLAAVFELYDNTNVYFRWGTAYKAAGASIRAAGFETYDPEELESYELGLKASLFDRRVQVNAAAFWSTYSDRQIDVANIIDVTRPVTINAENDIDINGFELDVTAVVTEGLVASLSYTYLGADNPTQPDPIFGVQTDGSIAETVQRIEQLPRHSGSLSLDYTFQPMSFGTLQAHLDVVSSGRKFYTADNAVDGLTDYTMVNARVTLSEIKLGSAPGTLKVAAWVRNLTDEEYAPFGFDNVASMSVGYNDPRMLGVDITYNY